MYIYIDESGNTGNNLFDESQPSLYALATITPANFDKIAIHQMAEIRKKANTNELHANELGLREIDNIAHALKKVIINFRIQFFFTVVEKKYVALAKLFDTLFDPYENTATPWSAYNIKLLRMILLYKFSQIITEEIVTEFWNNCIQSGDNEHTKKSFVKVCDMILNNAKHIGDKRAKEIIDGSLKWAKKYPKEIIYYSNSKQLRRMNAPNFVAFTTILPTLSRIFKKRKKQAIKIIHDEQSEFGEVFKYYHATVKKSKPYQPPVYFGIENVDFSTIKNSSFCLAPSSELDSLQLTDIALFLHKKNHESLTFYNELELLFNCIKKRTTINHFTFDDAINATEKELALLYSLPFGKQEQEKGLELMKQMEERRQAAMNATIERYNK